MRLHLCRPACNGNPPTSQPGIINNNTHTHKYCHAIYGRRYRWQISFWCPSPMEPLRTSAYTLYFWQEFWSAYNFPLMISVYLHWNFCGGRQNFCLLRQGGRFGHSRSSKVDEFGANLKHVCDFLLVRNTNHGPNLHRFRPTARFMFFRPPSLFNRNFWGCSRCTRSPMLSVNEHMDLKLFGREIIFEEFKPIWTRYLNVTDRRTDDMQSHNRALR